MLDKEFNDLPGIKQSDLDCLNPADRTYLSMWLKKLPTPGVFDRPEGIINITSDFVVRMSSGDPMYYKPVIKIMISYILKTFEGCYTKDFFFKTLLSPLIEYGCYPETTKQYVHIPYFEQFFKEAKIELKTYLTEKDANEILNAENQEPCPFMRFRQTVPFIKSNFYQNHCDLKDTDYRSNLHCKKRDQNCLQMLLNECKQIVKS